MRLAVLLSLLLILPLIAEVRVIHWEDNNKIDTIARFYTSTNNLLSPDKWKEIKTVNWLVNEYTNKSYNAMINLPRGIHYIYGINSNSLGTSKMSDIIAITNNMPLRIDIESIVNDGETILIKFSEK